MVNTLYITRGLPGSGKSSAITKHIALMAVAKYGDGCPFPTFKYFEADYYHGSPYNWKQENQSAAHLYCRLSVQAAINNGIEEVYVGNTNIKQKDYQNYIDYATANGYDVKFLMPDTPWAMDVDECFARNVHKVPKETIQRMKDSFEPDYRYPVVKV